MDNSNILSSYILHTPWLSQEGLAASTKYKWFCLFYFCLSFSEKYHGDVVRYVFIFIGAHSILFILSHHSNDKGSFVVD